jgi:antitoxin VapB
VRETLADIGSIFAMFSPSFMAQGREFHPERERDWNERDWSADGTTASESGKV